MAARPQIPPPPRGEPRTSSTAAANSASTAAARSAAGLCARSGRRPGSCATVNTRARTGEWYSWPVLAAHRQRVCDGLDAPHVAVERRQQLHHGALRGRRLGLFLRAGAGRGGLLQQRKRISNTGPCQQTGAPTSTEARSTTNQHRSTQHDQVAERQYRLRARAGRARRGESGRVCEALVAEAHRQKLLRGVLRRAENSDSARVSVQSRRTLQVNNSTLSVCCVCGGGGTTSECSSVSRSFTCATARASTACARHSTTRRSTAQHSR
jgi:hypothetical protein